jgi:hypothetical protein
MQATDTRVRSGAPDFETLAPSITWDGGQPDGSHRALVYKPIANSAGWQRWKSQFFASADAILCIPSNADALQLMVIAAGRVIVDINGETVLSRVRYRSEGSTHVAATLECASGEAVQAFCARTLRLPDECRTPRRTTPIVSMTTILTSSRALVGSAYLCQFGTCTGSIGLLSRYTTDSGSRARTDTSGTHFRGRGGT